MRIKVIKTFASALYDLHENQVAEVTEEFARELIRDGIAEPVQSVETMALRNSRNGPQSRIKRNAPAS